MSSKQLLSAAFLWTVGVATCSLSLAEAAQPAESDIEAIRSAAAAYIRALEEGNREALLAAWTADGDYVDAAGRTFKARDLITEEFADGRAARRENLRVTIEQIRLVTPEVAIEDGAIVFAPAPGESAAGSRYTAVWAKREGRWLLDSLRESALPLPPRNTRLADLGWLLGEFAGQSADGLQVVTSAAWSSDGNYILREFVVTLPDGRIRTISQRIGWDALRGTFRSWTFEADGAYNEGLWRREGDSWIVQSTGVTSDGKRNSATNIYMQISDDSFVLESVAATIEGQSQPDLKIKLVRHTPLP